MRAIRRPTGSLLVELAVSLLLILSLIVPVLLFAVDLAFFLNCRVTLDSIASQAANYPEVTRYWLGVRRPYRNQGVPYSDAIYQTEVADTLIPVTVQTCHKFGFSSVVDSDVQVVVENLLPDSLGSPEFDRISLKLTARGIRSRLPLRVNAFGFDFTNLFPDEVVSSGATIWAQQTPYAMLQIDCGEPTPGGVVAKASHPLDSDPATIESRAVCFLPSIGFFKQDKPLTGEPGETYYPDGPRLGKQPYEGANEPELTKYPQQCRYSYPLSSYTTRNAILRLLDAPSGEVRPRRPITASDRLGVGAEAQP